MLLFAPCMALYCQCLLPILLPLCAIVYVTSWVTNTFQPMCCLLLQQVRAAIGDFSGAKLVIVEACIASNLMTTTHTPRICGDVHMLVQYGDAKERTEAEFGSLLTASGFKLNRILPTKSLFFVLEASPV